MKYCPILFSAPMVRAILSGQKTQTRRVAKLTDAGHVKEPRGHRRWHPGDPDATKASPYGQPGDRLWVRETWAKNEGGAGGYCYRADHGGACAYEAHDLGKGLVTHKVSKWKPSIHMPRAASRITLEITGVRVERLDDISRNDAIAEGVHRDTAGRWTTYSATESAREHLSPAEAYRDLWESINGTGSWEANPWVWVVEFKRIQPIPGIYAAQSAI